MGLDTLLLPYPCGTERTDCYTYIGHSTSPPPRITKHTDSYTYNGHSAQKRTIYSTNMPNHTVKYNTISQRQHWRWHTCGAHKCNPILTYHHHHHHHHTVKHSTIPQRQHRRRIMRIDSIANNIIHKPRAGTHSQIEVHVSVAVCVFSGAVWWWWHVSI